jgi:integrase/recombinase XerD
MTRVHLTLFVRHGVNCEYRGEEFFQQCNCRKHFRWRAPDGEQHRRAAGTRSWTEAEAIKRDLEDQLSGLTVSKEMAATTLLSDAVALFIQDKRVQGISASALDKYVRELGRLVKHCAKIRVLVVRGLTRDVLTGYAATWAETYPSSQTRVIVKARLRGFLRYCYEAQWLERIPALPKIAVDESPTMPLTEDEVAALLAAGDTPQERALVLLMRWTGLAVGDSLKLPRASLQHVESLDKWRVQTARQKTGVHVEVVIPDFVAKTLNALTGDGKYFFWDGKSDIVNTWTRRRIPRIFAAAGIAKAGNMTSHRLRDTFACYYLEKGVPLPDVSKMLGHESIKTTERSYAKWVKGRQARLDAVVINAWAA